MAILWMGMIYFMSDKPAKESSNMSDGVSYKIINTANKMFDLRMTKRKKQIKAKQLRYPVRKCAHMTEYAVLGFIFYIHSLSYGIILSRKKRLLMVCILVIAYASTDEYHQTFVSGRSGNVLDVCIDGVGGFIGTLITSGIFRKQTHL